MESEEMMQPGCHPERSRGISTFPTLHRSLRVARLCLALVGMTIVVGNSAHAEDEKPAEVKTETPAKDPNDKSYRFAPDFCDFEITFPETPAIAKKCIPGNECYDVNSYTMVYDLQTTVDVSVTCTPSTPAAFERYNEGVMKAALAGMIETRGLQNHDTQYQEFENTKSGSLTGTGISGQSEKIYSAQLWIGKNSIFTVQAELIGEAHDKADASFRDILQSIKGKEGKQVPRKAKAASIPKATNQ